MMMPSNNALELAQPEVPLEPAPPSQKKKRGEKVHGCPVCSGRAYTSRKALNKHVDQYHKKLVEGQADSHTDNPNACRLCVSKVFKDVQGLKRHNKSFHAEFILSSKGSLAKEEAPETSEEAPKEAKKPQGRLTCSRCPNKAFNSLQGLKKHTTQAHKEKLSIIEEPLAVAETSEAMEVGEAAAPEKPQQKMGCARCPKKTFKNMRGLKKHTVQAHKDSPVLPQAVPEAVQAAGDGKLTCPTCPRKRAFKSPESLERHATKKHNVAPVVKYPEYEETETGLICSACPNKVFKTKQLIQLHRRKQHRPNEVQKRRPCPSCWKSFHKKGQLKLHISRVHEKRGTENAS